MTLPPGPIEQAANCVPEEPTLIPGSLLGFRLVGVSYRTANLEVRGRLGFTGERLRALLEDLKAAGLSESVVFSTCNRTEILLWGGNPWAARRVLAARSGVSEAELQDHLYVLEGEDVAAHLFRLCCGLESAALGETEILRQVKEAWRTSLAVGTGGPWTDLLLRNAFTAAKRARTNTDINRGVTSLASLAMAEAAKLADGLEDRTVLIIGAGQIAERVLKDLASRPVGRVIITNRTLTAARALAAPYGFEVWPFTQLSELIGIADVAVTAIGSPEPIVTRELTSTILEGRDARPLIFIDLGVPANVCPMAAILPGVQTVNIDHLIARCEANGRRRDASVPQVEAILEDSLRQLRKAMTEREAGAAIAAIAQRCEEVRQTNLAWALAQLDELSPEQRKVIEDLSIRMSRGLMENPIRALKSPESGPLERALVRRLFENPRDED